MRKALPLGLWAAWAMYLPTLPFLALQAGRVRKIVPRLPEAMGLRHGTVHGAGKPLRLAILGESTAVGVGAERHSEALPGYLASFVAAATDRQMEWQLIGANGATVRRLHQTLSTEPMDESDVAVVLLGVNDVFRMSSLATWRSGLARLVQTLNQQGCRHVVFSSVPPIGRFRALPQPMRAALGIRAALLDWYLPRTVCGFEGTYYCLIDFPHAADHVASDGVHPSARGYEHWARQLADQVLEVEA